MNLASILSLVGAAGHYWPAVVAGLYLLYLLAAYVGGDTSVVSQIPVAFGAFAAAIGVATSGAATKASCDQAHDRIDEIIDPR